MWEYVWLAGYDKSNPPSPPSPPPPLTKRIPLVPAPSSGATASRAQTLPINSKTGRQMGLIRVAGASVGDMAQRYQVHFKMTITN